MKRYNIHLNLNKKNYYIAIIGKHPFIKQWYKVQFLFEIPIFLKLIGTNTMYIDYNNFSYID